MANRYWVGGTGTWSSTNTANWSATSGGASGASVPTAADNVFFNAFSNVGTGSFTVTMANSPRVCNDITISGLDGAMTLAGASIGLTVSGSLSFPATNFTRSYTGTTTFNATTTGKTVTTNGVAFGGAVTFDGTGGGWTLGSAFSCGTSALTITSGNFNTSAVGNYSITCGTFFSSSSSTRTISLNASTVSISSTWATTTTTGLTFNAGTSQINLTLSASTFSGGPITYYNVSFTSAVATPNIKAIEGSSTFNNLTFTAPSTAGVNSVTFSGNQTINGTLTASGASSVRRLFLSSTTPNASRTLTCASIAATSDTDFRDITIAGAHGTLSGTRLGNCGTNTNITFAAGVTKYWNLAAGGNWSSTAWALSSGGAVAVNNFPLAQDSVVIENTGLNTGATITIDAYWNIGSFDASTRTNAMTFATGTTNPVFYGNFAYGSGVTPSGSGAFYFYNSSIKTLDSGGKTFTQSVYVVGSSGGGIQLVTNNLTLQSYKPIYLNRGTLDLNNLNVTAGAMYQSGSSITLAFGTTGSVTLNQSTNGAYVFYNDVFVTITGTQSITVAPTAFTAVTFYATQAYNQSFVFSGTGPVLLVGSYIGGINFSGYTGTITRASPIYFNQDVTLSSGMTWTPVNYIIYFLVTDGLTKNITSNGKTIPSNVEFTGGSWRLQDSMTVTTPYPSSVEAATKLTAGSIDLNNFTLTTHSFSLSNSINSARSIAFGTGNITCTQPNNGYFIFVMYYGFGFTFTGTPTVNLSSTMTSGYYATFSGASTYTSSANVALNFNVTSGSYAFYLQYYTAFGTTGSIGGIDFTGFSGPMYLSGYVVTQNSLKFSSTMTLLAYNSSYYYYMYPPSGTTIDITTSGKIVPNNFYFSGANSTATCRLLDALTATGNTAFYAGALNLNGQTLTTSRIDATSTPFTLTFNGGNVAVTTNAFNNTIGTNLTTVEGTGAGTISMTSAGSKTFSGGGATYNCTLNQGGIGALTISGSNTFKDITNSVQPVAVYFTAGTTQTFTDDFSLSGTAGNLVTIGSVTAASHTLSKASGVISVSYCTISRSNATGGAAWQAYTSNGNVDAGNNTGWMFVPATIYDVYIAESSTASDALLAYAAFLSSVDEQAAIADITQAALTLAPAITEVATGTDTTAATKTFAATTDETATGLDAVTTNLTIYGEVMEQVQGYDSVFASAMFAAAVNELIVGADTVNAPGSIYNAALAETTNAQDLATTSATLNAAIQETLTVADLLFANYLWNLIDDSQTAGWTGINTSTATTWNLVDDSAPTTWQNVNTLS